VVEPSLGLCSELQVQVGRHGRWDVLLELVWKSESERCTSYLCIILKGPRFFSDNFLEGRVVRK